MIRISHRLAVADKSSLDVWSFAKNGHSVQHEEKIKEFITSIKGSYTSIIAENVIDHIVNDDSFGKDITKWVTPGGLSPHPKPCINFSIVEFTCPEIGGFKQHEAACIVATIDSKSYGGFDDLRGKRCRDDADSFSYIYFITYAFGVIRVCSSIGLCEYGKDGSLLCSPSISRIGTSEEQEIAASSPIILTYLSVAMLTFGFANCKNIKIVDAEGDFSPDRPWARKNSAPNIKYHVLKIESPKSTTNHKSQSGQHPSDRALHICRGHFRVCEKPFGRNQPQTMWIPQHARGKAENGIVLKDYSIGKIN